MDKAIAIAKSAAQAARVLASQTNQQRNLLLHTMANSIRRYKDKILLANKKDIAFGVTKNLSDAMVDRLILTEDRIEEMAKGIEVVAELPDTLGNTRELPTRPNGLKISKMQIPLGVICMIYEARPNVTADAAALCIKSGNAVVLRGGKEALHSSLAIAKVLQQVLEEFGLPREAITVVDNPDRQLMFELLQQKDFIDLVIPRGGEGLIQFVSKNSQIPVIQHFKGVCHLYVDKSADFNKALSILKNGKTQRVGVCNALEGLLVHKDIAEQFLPLANQLFREKQVKVNACADSVQFFDNSKQINASDFGEEYLSLEIAVRVVNGVAEAVDHIDTYGSNHTEVICTEDDLSAAYFQKLVDASVVMVNASSRFSDGSQLGLGAEIGIATTKLHAYGPMGIESLTTEKFLVNGNGQVRA